MRKALKVQGKRSTIGPAARPLGLEPREALLRRFETALQRADGLDGAHCVHELWMRGEYPQRIESGLERLWQHAAASIPEWLPTRYVQWLGQAYEVCGAIRPATPAAGKKQRRGRHGLYLVLLDFADRRGDPHGVYVGMSSYPAMARFDQHKAGIRAAGAVLKRGLEVLTGPVLHLQKLSRAEAARLETQVAAALADAGVRVEGGH